MRRTRPVSSRRKAAKATSYEHVEADERENRLVLLQLMEPWYHNIPVVGDSETIFDRSTSSYSSIAARSWATTLIWPGVLSRSAAVGGGAAARERFAVALPAGEAVVAPPPEEARGWGRRHILDSPGKQRRGRRPSRPSSPRGSGRRPALSVRHSGGTGCPLGPYRSFRAVTSPAVATAAAATAGPPPRRPRPPTGRGHPRGRAASTGGRGFIAAQPFAPLQGPSKQAALSAAVKARGNATADLWCSWEAQTFYAARGLFHVPEGMSNGFVRHVLTTVAGASDEAMEQLRSLFGLPSARRFPTRVSEGGPNGHAS